MALFTTGLDAQTLALANNNAHEETPRMSLNFIVFIFKPPGVEWLSRAPVEGSIDRQTATGGRLTLAPVVGCTRWAKSKALYKLRDAALE